MARWGWSSFSFHFILLPFVNCFAPLPTSLTPAAILFLHRSLSWPLFFLPSRLWPQPTNLLIGFYLGPNEVLLYWDNFSKSVTCTERLHLTFALINGEPLTKRVRRPHAPRMLISFLLCWLHPNARNTKNYFIPLFTQEVVAWIITAHALPLRWGLCVLGRDGQWVLSHFSVQLHPIKPESTDTCPELLFTQKLLLFKIFR